MFFFYLLCTWEGKLLKILSIVFWQIGQNEKIFFEEKKNIFVLPCLQIFVLVHSIKALNFDSFSKKHYLRHFLFLFFAVCTSLFLPFQFKWKKACTNMCEWWLVNGNFLKEMQEWVRDLRVYPVLMLLSLALWVCQQIHHILKITKSLLMSLSQLWYTKSRWPFCFLTCSVSACTLQHY